MTRLKCARLSIHQTFNPIFTLDQFNIFKLHLAVVLFKRASYYIYNQYNFLFLWYTIQSVTILKMGEL